MSEGEAFESLFDAPLELVRDAPGRINLLGEHTDYHGGFVLPIVTPHRTRAALRARPDRRVRAASGAFANTMIEYELGSERRSGDWADYVRGVTHVLGSAGHPICGFDLFVDSDVPVGAGLSSSAALEVSVLRALRDRCDVKIDDVELAKIAHAAETMFVGAPVGVMDQMAASVGRPRHALFLDTRSLEFEHVPWMPGADLAGIDSGIAHAHASGEYATRRRESFDAARRLGVETLRELGVGDAGSIEALPSPLAGRARHVVTENARVLAGVAALRAGDAAALGRLVNESHASLRDDYEVSLPDIDSLVVRAQNDPDVFGARLTGGGFGGSVIVITRAGRAAGVAARVISAYSAETGRAGRFMPL